jgi:hypothetical protein
VHIDQASNRLSQPHYTTVFEHLCQSSFVYLPILHYLSTSLPARGVGNGVYLLLSLDPARSWPLQYLPGKFKLGSLFCVLSVVSVETSCNLHATSPTAVQARIPRPIIVYNIHCFFLLVPSYLNISGNAQRRTCMAVVTSLGVPTLASVDDSPSDGGPSLRCSSDSIDRILGPNFCVRARDDGYPTGLGWLTAKDHQVGSCVSHPEILDTEHWRSNSLHPRCPGNP